MTDEKVKKIAQKFPDKLTVCRTNCENDLAAIIKTQPDDPRFVYAEYVLNRVFIIKPIEEEVDW